jgi:hypothetical protein
VVSYACEQRCDQYFPHTTVVLALGIGCIHFHMYFENFHLIEVRKYHKYFNSIWGYFTLLEICDCAKC